MTDKNSALDETAPGEDQIPGEKPRDRKDEATGADIGSALRSAYQQTVSEGIPDELMDLLNRLS